MRRNRKAVEIAESQSQPGINFSLSMNGGLFQEADAFNDEKRLVKMTVLRQGWSHNGVYYGENAVDQIVEALNRNAKKVYTNHPSKPTDPRRNEDWIGTVKSAIKEKNAAGVAEAKAVVYMHPDGPNAYLYNRMKETNKATGDGSVDWGPSIIGRAFLSEGVRDGRKGKIFEQLQLLRSFDVVTDPSAGGSVDAIVETRLFEGDFTNGDGKSLKELKEGLMDTLKEKAMERKTRDDLWNIMHTFQCMICGIVFAEEDYEYLSVDDRKAEAASIIDELKVFIAGLTFSEPSVEPAVAAEQKKETKTPTNHKGKSMNKKELKEQHLDLYNEIVQEAVAEHNRSQEAQDAAKEQARIVAEHATLTEENKTLKTSVATLTEENKTLLGKTAEFDAQRIAAKKSELVKEVCEAEKLPANLRTDVFVNDLVALSFTEGKEDDFKAEVKKRVLDRKSTAGVKPVVEGASFGKPTSDKEVSTVSAAKEFAEGLKS